MSVRVMGACWRVEGLPRVATRHVLIAIADSCDDDGWTWVGAEKLAEKTGLSVRHVRRAIAELVEAGVVRRVEWVREDGMKTAAFLRVLVGADDPDAPPPIGRRPGHEARPPVAVRGDTGGRSPSETTATGVRDCGHGWPLHIEHVDPSGEPSGPPLPPQGGSRSLDVVPSDTAQPHSEPSVRRPPTAASLAPSGPVERVFKAWADATGHHQARLNGARRRLIQARLRELPEEDVIDAVRGWRHSPFHCGDNDQGTTYNRLELLLRNLAYAERFRDLERNPPRRLPTTRLDRHVATAPLDRLEAAPETRHGAFGGFRTPGGA